jgi:hypothetical protein
MVGVSDINLQHFILNEEEWSNLEKLEKILKVKIYENFLFLNFINI